MIYLSRAFVRLASGWVRNAHPENLMGCFIIKGKAGDLGERPSLSFLRRGPVSPISSPPRKGREAYPSLDGQARTVVALGENTFRSQYNEGLSF